MRRHRDPHRANRTGAGRRHMPWRQRRRRAPGRHPMQGPRRPVPGRVLRKQGPVPGRAPRERDLACARAPRGMVQALGQTPPEQEPTEQNLATARMRVPGRPAWLRVFWPLTQAHRAMPKQQERSGSPGLTIPPRPGDPPGPLRPGAPSAPWPRAVRPMQVPPAQKQQELKAAGRKFSAQRQNHPSRSAPHGYQKQRTPAEARSPACPAGRAS